MSADMLPLTRITDRDEAIARIRAGLKKRTGRPWSVTGGRGTAWGWIRIGSPPARRVCYTCAGPHERHPRDYRDSNGNTCGSWRMDQ